MCILDKWCELDKKFLSIVMVPKLRGAGDDASQLERRLTQLLASKGTALKLHAVWSSTKKERTTTVKPLHKRLADVSRDHDKQKTCVRRVDELNSDGPKDGDNTESRASRSA